MAAAAESKLYVFLKLMASNDEDGDCEMGKLLLWSPPPSLVLRPHSSLVRAAIKMKRGLPSSESREWSPFRVIFEKETFSLIYGSAMHALLCRHLSLKRPNSNCNSSNFMLLYAGRLNTICLRSRGKHFCNKPRDYCLRAFSSPASVSLSPLGDVVKQ